MDEMDASLEAACICGFLDDLVREYLAYCQRESVDDRERVADKKASRKNKNRFPNVAGFCRYFHIGSNEYDILAAKYPDQFDRLVAIFEDEAFNSDVSPTLLSAYLKKRLGYEKNNVGEIYDGELKVVFEHDILEDGE